MGRKVITVLAIVAIVIAALQRTPMRFLSGDSADFVWGFAVGLSLAALVSWLIAGPSSRVS